MLNALGIEAARAGLRKGEFSAHELAEASLAAIGEAKGLNAIIRVNEERARTEAGFADSVLAQARKGGNDAPDLCGIPIAIKDIFCVRGERTQAGSKILEGFTPSYESTVSARLWSQGAVLMGTANMDEFAMGSSNETSIYGPAINPWRKDRDLTPGGSSGGSAAAVSADLALGAMATDTGGSIRQPASFTATVGIKPTYGRVSRYGIIAFASSLDQAGPIAKSVRDGAILLGAISGHDEKDSTSANIAVPDFEEKLGASIKGKTIGVPREYRIDGMPAEIEAIWEKGRAQLADLGARLVDVSLPRTRYALPAYYVIAPAEASSNLARYDGVRYGYRAGLGADDGINELYLKTRGEGFGDEVKRRVLIGTYVLSAGFYDAYYLRAQKIRSLIKADFDEVFASGVDALLTPTTPSAAFGIGEMDKLDPVKMYLNDVFTVTVNLAGLPAISIPAGLSDGGLPLGLQLIGRAFDEAGILSIAHALESQIGFCDKPDKWWMK